MFEENESDLMSNTLQHGGVRVSGLSCGLLIIELLTAGAGSAFGIATYLGGKKY